MTLYSYCLRIDAGAAPNPYWEVCTLAICKPAIRRTAGEGDWVAGLGAMHSPIGDCSGKLVYAMKVSTVLPMREYDEHCCKSLREKIPDWSKAADFRRKVGDSIYDYSHSGQPKLRPSVHTESNRKVDLGGLKVLLSKHFYYFGDKPIELPECLSPILQQTQGHKSRANDKYLDQFVTWIEGKGYRRNAILGEPQDKGRVMSMSLDECRSAWSRQHHEEDEHDEIC